VEATGVDRGLPSSVGVRVEVDAAVDEGETEFHGGVVDAVVGEGVVDVTVTDSAASIVSTDVAACAVATVI